MKELKLKSGIVITILLLLCLLPCFSDYVMAEEDITLKLYAKSAVLMDGDSGRVLYEKNAAEILPMASTTKIMTGILALEHGKPEDVVTISKYASTMPDVQLNAKEKETYYLKDLLYSLMLESHNDTAVAIAEHISGSVEEFARLMNEKARSIGCENTHFVTPNGLDRQDTQGEHSTTAEDLAAIMRYCILQSPKKEDFIEITRTPSHSFSDLEGKRNFSCNNHNVFLQMMEGALSGKTGFTAKAGYCYVGSLKRDGNTYIVALLACGWPNNKNYKWSDTKALMNYGLEHYTFQGFDEIPIDKTKLGPILVEMGQTIKAYETPQVSLKIEKGVSFNENHKNGLLMKENEKIEVVYNIKNKLIAPVAEEETVGTIQYCLEGEVLREDFVLTTKEVKKIDYKWCVWQILKRFLNC